MDKNFNLVEPKLQNIHADEINCNVQIGQHFYSIVLVSKKTGEIISAVHKEVKNLTLGGLLLEELENTEINLSLFKSLTFGILTPYFSLVPSAIFDQNKLNKYLTNEENKEGEKDLFLSHCRNKQLEINFVQGIQAELNSFLKSTYPNCTINHHTKSFIDSVISEFDTNNSKQIYVHVSSKGMTVVYFRKMKLHYCNFFSFETSEDFIYYLLFVCEQLKVSPNDTKLILVGNIKIGEKLHHFAYSYFSKIQLGNTKHSAKTSTLLNEIPKHFFFTIHREHLCA